jgi:hypothetical protein
MTSFGHPRVKEKTTHMLKIFLKKSRHDFLNLNRESHGPLAPLWVRPWLIQPLNWAHKTS